MLQPGSQLNVFSPNYITKSIFCHICLCTIDVCNLMRLLYDKCCVSLSACFPSPPGLSVLQGHLSLDSMDEQHSEKLWLCSSINLPRSAPTSVSKAQLLDGYIEFRMRDFKTNNGRIHDCTLH